jgi:hypothetical protein
MQNDEMNALKEFLGAVERGRSLHPELLTKQEWEKALKKEFRELCLEFCYWVPCNPEQNCAELAYRGYKAECPPEICLKHQKKYHSEIMDVIVVAYRMMLASRERIKALETKIAMELDPR